MKFGYSEIKFGLNFILLKYSALVKVKGDGWLRKREREIGESPSPSLLKWFSASCQINRMTEKSKNERNIFYCSNQWNCYSRGKHVYFSMTALSVNRTEEILVKKRIPTRQRRRLLSLVRKRKRPPAVTIGQQNVVVVSSKKCALQTSTWKSDNYFEMLSCNWNPE